MASKRKRIVACELCRERKVKCNGEFPCTNCLDRGEQCFVADKKSKRRVYPAEEDDPLTQRLSRIEALLDGKATGNPDAFIHRNEPTSLAEEPPKSLPESNTRKPEQVPVPKDPPESSLVSLHLAPERASPAREDGSVFSADTSNLEYVGPRTFLSVCSAPAVSWISSQLQNDSYQPVAARLLRDITTRLRPSQSVPLQRKPEPSSEDAWKYTAAYFAEAPEAAFGVVNRARFEKMLRKHFQGQALEYDPAWYALRNIVFAYGCRISLSKTASFREANQESEGWFFNALTAHTDLLYFRTSIMGLQALILMTYFTETLGGPSLQHMLVACAVRLACAKGLHRQPCPSWKLHPDESAHRSWIFWAIYCLDKHISVRSGRPSAVDDDEVSCSIPTSSPTSNTANVWYCTTMVKMAKLMSRIGKELSSTTAMGQPPEVVLGRVRDLNEELQAFADSLKPVFDLNQPSDLAPRIKGLTSDQALRVGLMYDEVVFALHSIISRPWLRLVCPWQAESTPYQCQVSYSAEIAASTARNVILACSNMHLSAQCPHWYALSVPFTACINLFVHILQFPDRESIQSDLSLLDVVAGHFARLEFSTQSIISHSFARDVAQLARAMVSKAKSNQQHDINAPVSAMTSHQPLRSFKPSNFDDQSTGHPGEFDLDTWFNMEMWLPIEF